MDFRDDNTSICQILSDVTYVHAFRNSTTLRLPPLQIACAPITRRVLQCASWAADGSHAPDGHELRLVLEGSRIGDSGPEKCRYHFVEGFRWMAKAETIREAATGRESLRPC